MHFGLWYEQDFRIVEKIIESIQVIREKNDILIEEGYQNEMTGNYSINILSTYRFQVLIILFSICMLVLAASFLASGYPIVTSSFNNTTASVNTNNVDDDASLQIVKVVAFNNTTPSSIVVDTLRNLVYVSVNPGYPYNYTLSLCEENDTSQQPAIANALSACSAIYVLDGDSGLIKNTIHLGPGEQIKEISIDAEKRRLYASGEYNYQDVDPHSNEEIQFEDDVVYIIDSDNGSSSQTSDNISRITLYGEMEDGKEGDTSDIALDTTTNTIYAGIRYFQGGREGVFVIPEGSVINKNISLGSNDDAADATQNGIKFIQLGNTGPDQVIINEATDIIYASLKNDDFIAIINGSSNTTKEEVILEKPRAMSLNPTNRLFYVASGDSHWFNVVDAETNKVVAVNKQISYPLASVADNTTGKVYVADCLRCDDYDFTTGTSIYELYSNGTTVNWKTYEHIDLKENALAINPSEEKLYTIGTDAKWSNLYIIDISSH